MELFAQRTNLPTSWKRGGCGCGATRESILATTASIPSSARAATMLARDGDIERISLTVTSSQIGRIVVSADNARFRRPSNSHWVQCLLRNARLSTTTPKRDSERPRSMALRRLSPIFRTCSSYQTVRHEWRLLKAPLGRFSLPHFAAHPSAVVSHLALPPAAPLGSPGAVDSAPLRSGGSPRSPAGKRPPAFAIGPP